LTFDKPGIVLLGCNIHDTMVAWVAVVDSNWFGRTDATGRLKLHDVPDGVYQLHVWHPGQLGEFAARELKVTPATATQAVKLDATDIATLLKSAGSPAHPEGDS
jgi:hypothetical protein